MAANFRSELDLMKQKSTAFRGEVQERVLGYILAAFGLVAGLAWNDAVRALIDSILPAAQGGIIAKFIYAIVVSLLVVIVSVYLVRIMERAKRAREAVEEHEKNDA